MRVSGRAVAALLLVAACVAAPSAVAGQRTASPPVDVLQALSDSKPRPATGQQAVALARGHVHVPSALARPYRAELGWTAQWQGHEWWLVGVFESDWGVRFVVRAAVRGHYVRFGSGPTREWILANAQPSVTTLYARFDPAVAVAKMQAEMMALPSPAPNVFDPRDYTILDGSATLVRDEPQENDAWGSGPGWWFVYYAHDLATGQNVVLPVTGAGYDPPAPESSIGTGRTSGYGFYDFWVRPNVRPADASLDDWIDSVIAARGWQPTGWPSTGTDFTFLSIPPIVPRPPIVVPRRRAGGNPSPTTAREALAVVHENPDVADALARPFATGGDWTAQWRGRSWWLVGVFRSEWGKRFVVRASVVGHNVQFGVGPRKRWILRHARPRVRKTVYTRLRRSSAVALLKAEILAQPTPQFDPSKYSILAGAAKLVRDVDSGPAWSFVFYAQDLATGKNVVLPVTSPSRHALIESTYDTSTPGATAYGFTDHEVLLTVPSNRPQLAKWIRAVVARRNWHPTNFH